MQQLINKPTDPYSPLWADYWQQNPSLHRSVGSAGDNGDGDDGGGGEVGGDKTPTIEELMQQVKSLSGEREKLLNKNQELLGENKTYKQARREAEEAAEQARKEKLLKDNDHEQLYKSSEAEREKLAQQLAELQQGIQKKEVSAAAMKLALKSADGYNAELLAEQYEKRMKYSEGDVKVTDTSGGLTVSSLDDLEAEFKASGRFDSLYRGNQASGGGAPGGDRGSASKSKKPADMTSAEKSAFIAEHGLEAWQKHVGA